jgi:hypothetical protein
MAYQNVGTPRFWINEIAYRNAIGANWISSASQDTLEHKNIYQLNPTHQNDFNGGVSSLYLWTQLDYVMLLGHKFNTNSCSIKIEDENGLVTLTNTKNIINDNVPSFDGWSYTMWETIYGQHGDGNRLDITFANSSSIGSICVGKTFDMGHAADLSLSLTYNYDGIKKYTTRGGATLSSAEYTGPAKWGSRAAWELGTAGIERTGRRMWTMSFSYLDANELMPKLFSHSNIESSYYDYANTSADTLGDVAGVGDFYSSVITKTMGGHLPFIFQPDNTNDDPDQFAICRFDMKAFSYEQVSHNVYDMKLKIVEVW